MNGLPQLSVVFWTSPFFPPPPRRSAVKALHQLIQQIPDAVVMFRNAGNRFVTHGADAAHLKPLHEAPVQKNMKWNEKLNSGNGYIIKGVSNVSNWSFLREETTASRPDRVSSPIQLIVLESGAFSFIRLQFISISSGWSLLLFFLFLYPSVLTNSHK